MISKTELEALKVLKGKPDGIVLTQPYDEDSALKPIEPPKPLYLYESTAYVSAFSEKQVFLEDQVNLEITGYDWKTRRESVEDFFDNPEKEFLSENNISYLYQIKSKQMVNQEYLKTIFENGLIKISKTSI
jgi:hypothetical protein